MLFVPEARLVCTVTATNPGTSFTLTPIAGESDALGITSVVVACAANPNGTRLTERVEIRLAALGG